MKNINTKTINPKQTGFSVTATKVKPIAIKIIQKIIRTILSTIINFF